MIEMKMEFLLKDGIKKHIEAESIMKNSQSAEMQNERANLTKHNN